MLRVVRRALGAAEAPRVDRNLDEEEEEEEDLCGCASAACGASAASTVVVRMERRYVDASSVVSTYAPYERMTRM